MAEYGVGIKNPLFFVGVVENNDDPQMEGRVQVRAFSVHGTNKQIPTPELPWAIVASGSYDLSQPPPPLNSFVYGMFLDGRDAQQPMILGLIPGQYQEVVDPDKNGWGVVPHRNGVELAKGTDPRSIGNPSMSRLARGENVEETYVLQQEMGRTEEQKIAGTDKHWSQPSSAYNSQYPHNRVIETAHHSIELDDTPDGERIMIHHKAGSYIQIDSSGTVSENSSGDRYEVTDGNYHQSVGNEGGNYYVTIGGNAHVYVKGNKTEEIEGDYNLIVRGNAQLGSGGAMYLNAEMLEARGGDVKIESKSTTSVKATKELFLGASGFVPGLGNVDGAPGPSGGDVKITGNKIYTTGYYSVESFSGLFTKITSVIDTHMTGSNLFIGQTGALPPVTPVLGAKIGTPSPNAPGITQGINIVSGVKTNISTGGTLSLQTGGAAGILTGGLFSVSTGGVMDFTVGAAMNINTAGVFSAQAGGAATIIAGGITSIDGSVVNIGMGGTPGVPTPPVIDVPGISILGLPSLDSIGVTMPEPPGKSTAIISRAVTRSFNNAGYVGSDGD
jgi:hypothetical protein